MTHKNMTPAATEKQREFGALLREIRRKAGLSRKELGQRLGDKTIVSVTNYEWTTDAGCLIPDELLQPYLALALESGVDPVDVMNAYCRADYERRPQFWEKEPTYPQSTPLSSPAPAINLYSIAISDPKFFLERVRWNPLRIQAAAERLSFWNSYMDLPGVASHCKAIAQDAKQMLDEYKQTGIIFRQFAHGLAGYEITKTVYLDGGTLKAALEMTSKPYTYRWGQELLRRTLVIFQRRVRNKYDK